MINFKEIFFFKIIKYKYFIYYLLFNNIIINNYILKFLIIIKIIKLFNNYFKTFLNHNNILFLNIKKNVRNL